MQYLYNLFKDLPQLFHIRCYNDNQNNRNGWQLSTISPPLSSLQNYSTFANVRNIILLMNKQQLINLLDALHITLEPELTAKIASFLATLTLSPNSPLSLNMLAIAGAALQADMAMVPAVGMEGRVHYGAPLQQFLRHIGESEKGGFFQAVGAILRQWKQAPPHLVTKFHEVTRTYNFFLHYRNLFRQFSARAGIEQGVAQRTMSAFWIVFLRAKNIFACKCRIGGEAVEMELMMALLGFALARVGAGRDEEILRAAFSREFGKEIHITKQLKEYYEKQYWEILDSAYNIRYDPEADVRIGVLLQNEDLLRRFVDDFGKSVERENGVNYEQINELAYLELDLPPLTPQSIARREPTGPPITRKLDYDDYEQESGEKQGPRSQEDIKQDEYLEKQTPAASSKGQEGSPAQARHEEGVDIFRHFTEQAEQGYAQVQRRRKRFVINKCQTRIFILKWVQEEMRAGERGAQGMLDELRSVADIRQYEMDRSGKIVELLEMVCGGCKDKQHRSAQIFRLFLAFLAKLRRNTKREDFLSIAGNPHYLDAFLCLTSLLFNYAYKTAELSFTQYCQHFGVTILTGFVPLNWMGINGELPKELQSFLFELQQRILFEQLWQGDAGEEVFRPKNSANFVEMAIKKRLFRHVVHRIGLLCKTELTDKDRSSLFKFVQEMMSTRLHLLRGNNLYILLICCINYCFGKTVPLQRVLESLRKNERISRATLEAKDEYGHPLSLEDYYHSVFLRELEPMTAKKQMMMQDMTPTKMTPSTAVRNCPSSCETKPTLAITHKYRFGEEALGQEKSTGEYRKKLAVKIFRVQSSPKSYSSSEGEE